MKPFCKNIKETRILEGDIEWKTYVRATGEFDLVLLEDPGYKSLFRSFFGGSTQDRLMEHSVCSVTSVQPRLLKEMNK